jgi:hypothetical protein
VKRVNQARRHFLKVVSLGIGGVIAASCVYAGSVEKRAKRSKPNLLFIMTDQQRFDAMSCAGNTVLETPNMDRIAREGVMFICRQSCLRTGAGGIFDRPLSRECSSRRQWRLHQ